MKKIFNIMPVCLFLVAALAQGQTDNNVRFVKRELNEANLDSLKGKTKNYNAWSVNINTGFNIPAGSFTTGYFSDGRNYFLNPSPNHFDINVRKMFNTKFGIMYTLGYDSFSSQAGSLPFNNHMFNTSLQGVLNIHRMLNWEEFTKSLGLQFHFGAGLSLLGVDRSTAIGSNVSSDKFFEKILTAVSGVTLLIKASDRVAVNIDYSVNRNFTQDGAFDGKSVSNLVDNRTGSIYVATVGATYYFGKKDKHADWYWEEKPVVNVNDQLLPRISALEAQLKDTNNDGVPDSVDALINSKIVTPPNTNFVVDGNQNYSNDEAVKLINSQYVNVFFDFDKSTISTSTISSINFVINYLKANPKATLDVIGSADAFGNSEYNLRLSEKRAKNVAEMILRSGIEGERLKVIGKGVDITLPQESAVARQLVRKVVFKVN